MATRTGPAGAGSAGTGPAGTGPAGTGPAGTGPAGTGPAGTGPAGTEPAGTGPAGPQPAPQRQGAVTGLDRLESGPPPPEPDIVPVARSAWAAAWPQLPAIALVLVLRQLVHLTRWESYVIEGPA